jgi:signal peptidase II
MRFLKIYRSLFLIALIVIGLDQITKELVRIYIPYGDYWSPWAWLAPYARLVHVSNTGVAFGLFQGQGILFTILAIVVSVAIIVYYPRVPAEDWTLRLAMGLQLAGAIGNLIDRIVFGYVTDFISVGNFAVFNIADSSITVGVGVLLLGIWIQERRQKKLQSIPAVTAETAPVETPGEETPKP